MTKANFIKQLRFKGKILLFVNIVCFLFAVPIYWAEVGHPDATVETFSESLWLIFASVATIGYGDEIVVTDAGKVLIFMVFILSRAAALLVLCLIGVKVVGGRAQDALGVNERLTVIENEMKSLHSVLYELDRTNKQTQKKLRSEKNKKAEVSVTTPESLIDLVSSSISKQLCIHCKFELKDLYDRDWELWLVIKQKAKESGVYSISFIDQTIRIAPKL
ncbi:TPA: two pore domain potassium channel family protein [Vibrio vulnificus]|uniref:Two pore domain potassium channel family protein n=1 Tax=Vibrio vulnificus TaxID=672 RepID=A0A8H9K5E8_VIBVL|nr:two pore domain potassium channel family protein [Vibrio vulnificus]HAS8538375.1 two pore domain potassium channel family protein [Vibrio vulnificus]